MRALRVAMVCPYSLSRPGGVQGQVLGLARALRAAGHEAAVLAPVDGTAEVEGLEGEELVSLGRSVALPANGSVAPVSLSPRAALRAISAVRAGGFDVLHFHEPLAPGPGYACLFRCSQPKVGTFHRAGAGAAYRVLGPLARWAAGHLDVRCAVSPEAMSTAFGALGGSYEVVGNGVELERFSTAVPWATKGPTVMFVGRHERRKGLGVLLDAWDRISGEARRGAPAGEGATLWVVGEGPQTAELRRRHPPGPGLEWLGRIGDEDLASRMAGAHLLCAPAIAGESFGMVLVEAMAARTAVVASDIPGYSFVGASHASLVPPGEREALAGALSAGLADARSGTGTCAPEALDAAFDRARHWSMEALAARYVGLYGALVD
ncbi:MAG TPA: glycosyltransferase family 4 protein [Acidimicrobiales bacterium]|nr:glycosyltransferase family 4 protein [Acidimicrobiales bacterium]